MNLAAGLLLALVFGLLFFDWATLRKRGRRMLLLEAAVFLGAAFFIVFPDAATAAAHFAGIGRGVDFFLYPLVLWLVRESLVHRQRRWEDGDRLTRVVRANALATARSIEVAGEGDRPIAP
jgi:small membrane protein